jgi:hypothetical protein
MSLGATYWTFCQDFPYLVAIPYTTNGALTGPYLWSNQGANNAFAVPSNAPGCRVGANVGQFLMLGDLYQTSVQTLLTGDGSTTTFSGTLTPPILATGSISDTGGHLTGTFANGVITGTGYLTGGTINFTTGAITLAFGTAPPLGDGVQATYTTVAPYRVWWSAIGDPTNWPIPLTNNAIAFQSGYQDLQADLGQVMFIAGYPQYALIFQRFGITRANYIGGAAVWQFAPYEFTRGAIAHGPCVQVDNDVFYLADSGWMLTDGANVIPIGTDQENSSGIDNWFWANVNQSALEAIRGGYDAEKRCVFFAIPTGTNTLPDTLLSFNPGAQRWTRSVIPVETIWTTDNGANNTPPTRQTLGVIDQTHTPNLLTGTPLTGYLETCDLFFVDGNRRITTGVRPQVAATDNPTCTIGVRDSLEASVTYGIPWPVDSFTNIAPALSSGMYTRFRLTSSAGTGLRGGTLLMEQGGPV